ncbi:hypothetical protein [Paucisalibacillus globulus]|uniref:hypothetical protein n=1 Tax=Paucisalibacillus globulus TaxID=351095 RepID=UPI001596907A|nr:hypothetical protein [Paucisalibacillus globulus]
MKKQFYILIGLVLVLFVHFINPSIIPDTVTLFFSNFVSWISSLEPKIPTF